VKTPLLGLALWSFLVEQCSQLFYILEVSKGIKGCVGWERCATPASPGITVMWNPRRTG